MTTHDDCVNCGEKGKDTYHIKVRGETHDEIPLFKQCYDAISDDIPLT